MLLCTSELRKLAKVSLYEYQKTPYQVVYLAAKLAHEKLGFFTTSFELFSQFQKDRFSLLDLVFWVKHPLIRQDLETESRR